MNDLFIYCMVDITLDRIDYMKLICFEKCNTNLQLISFDQLSSCPPWLLFAISSGHSLGSSDHYLWVFQWSKILKFLQPPHLLFHNPRVLHTGARPKQKIIISLAPQQQPSRMKQHQKTPIPYALGTPGSKHLPPKWAKYKEVLCWLWGDVRPPPSIKPNKPSQIDDLVSTFSNILDALPV